MEFALTFNRLDFAACMWPMSFQKSGAGQVLRTCKARHTHMNQVRLHLGLNSNIYADSFHQRKCWQQTLVYCLLCRPEIQNVPRIRVLVSSTSPYGSYMYAESMPHMLQAAFRIKQLHLCLLIFSTKMRATNTSLLRRTEMQNVHKQKHW